MLLQYCCTSNACVSFFQIECIECCGKELYVGTSDRYAKFSKFIISAYLLYNFM